MKSTVDRQAKDFLIMFLISCLRFEQQTKLWCISLLELFFQAYHILFKVTLTADKYYYHHKQPEDYKSDYRLPET